MRLSDDERESLGLTRRFSPTNGVLLFSFLLSPRHILRITTKRKKIRVDLTKTLEGRETAFRLTSEMYLENCAARGITALSRKSDLFVGC